MGYLVSLSEDINRPREISLPRQITVDHSVYLYTQDSRLEAGQRT